MSSVTPELAACLGPGSERWVHAYLLLVTGRIFIFCSTQNMYTQAPPGPSSVHWCTRQSTPTTVCSSHLPGTREVVPGLVLCLHPCLTLFIIWVNHLPKRNPQVGCVAVALIKWSFFWAWFHLKQYTISALKDNSKIDWEKVTVIGNKMCSSETLPLDCCVQIPLAFAVFGASRLLVPNAHAPLSGSAVSSF